jgi:hypothetical protein
MCFVWVWEQTAIISLYNINWLVCITETECVYCAVRTGSLYVIQLNLQAMLYRPQLCYSSLTPFPFLLHFIYILRLSLSQPLKAIKIPSQCSPSNTNSFSRCTSQQSTYHHAAYCTLPFPSVPLPETWPTTAASGPGENFLVPPPHSSKGGPTKILYTKSERKTVSCTVTWSCLTALICAVDR